MSDGYDVAQTATCFLYQYAGKNATEICGKDRRGKEISIKLACYREVDKFIDNLRNRSDRRGAIEYIDFTNYKALPMDPVNCFEREQTDYTKYKALPMDPVNCFEREQTDYTKYDELVDALRLFALELVILDC